MCMSKSMLFDSGCGQQRLMIKKMVTGHHSENVVYCNDRVESNATQFVTMPTSVSGFQ